MEENTNEKKKQKVVILVGLVTLLLAVLGATYAYFQISINTESSNTNITGKTPPKSLVTLTQGTSNLHLNISASDMSYENRTKEYYGTDDDQPYVGTEELGTKTIATVELTGGEATTKYSCTAKLTVSKVTDPEEEADTMIDVLHSGDMILQFKGNIISEQLDLSKLKENNPKEYNLSFKVTGNKVENIQAYIKLLNKNESQNYLAGKKLNIDVDTSELKCNIAEPETIDKLRANDENNVISENAVGGMYRYQGVGTKEAEDDTHKIVDNNYICFGTTDKEKCTNEETGYDKYMYRIIGITEEGQLKLIKMKGLVLNTRGDFSWHWAYLVSQCTGDSCKWPNVDIYKELNGEEGYHEPIFVNNSRYEYMVEENPWYKIIENHNWMYGDVSSTISSAELDGETVYGASNNGLILYDIETGAKPTQTYDYSQKKYVKHQWSAEKSIPAKIGLMYLHDYYLAYDNERNWADDNDKTNWIFIDNNNNTLGVSEEWFMTRLGWYASTVYSAWGVLSNGKSSSSQLNKDTFAARPTFYLTSDTKIKDGTGSIDDPYILDV